jgi:hypothetical protein
MRAHAWILVLIAAAASLPWAACSSGTAATGGMGGSTTSQTTTTTLPLAACDAPAVAPSMGACYTIPTHPPPPACLVGATDAGTPDADTDAGTEDGGATDAGSTDGGTFSCNTALPAAGACETCVEASCCAELTTCDGIADCLDCATDPDADPTTCSAAAVATALAAIATCQASCCRDLCTPPCNPVTNAGCDAAAMEICDVDMVNGGYSCIKTTGPVGLCLACDEYDGPFCDPGLTCLSDGSCGAYCCDDGDCGTGKCDMSQLPDEKVLGVCVHR